MKHDADYVNETWCRLCIMTVSWNGSGTFKIFMYSLIKPETKIVSKITQLRSVTSVIIYGYLNCGWKVNAHISS